MSHTGCSDKSWFNKGLCKDHDTNLFFAETGENLKTRKAKTICSGCPVRLECLVYALENKEPFGVWGGTTYRQRGRMMRHIGSPISIEKVKSFINAQ